MLSSAARRSILPSKKYQLSPKEFLLWMLGQRKRFTVTGESMQPLLKPHQQILVRKVSTVHIGDIVVVKHPQTGAPIVKRVAKVENDLIDIRGIAKNSTDSRHFGLIPITLVLGKMTVIL